MAKDTANSIGVNFCAIDKIKMELQVNFDINQHVCMHYCNGIIGI